MGEEGLAASILDTGALIAIERGDERVRAILQERTGRLVIPSPVLAQVWRDGARQARLAIVLRSRDTRIDVLDENAAKAAGVLCGRTGTSDIVDASVVISARLHHAVVVTSDPDDLRRIDPSIEVESL